MEKQKLYGPLRHEGIEICTKCGELATANSTFFPGTYKYGRTEKEPTCLRCQRKKERVRVLLRDWK